MYLIKKIELDETLKYKSSKIMAHTVKTITVALNLLENTLRSFVREERGRQAEEKVKIIDIHDMSQVNIPTDNCILLYRLTSNPHCILVYQDIKIKEEKWGLRGTYIVETSKFLHTHIFELEEYVEFDSTSNNKKSSSIETTNDPEMVKCGPGNMTIPKQMTLKPICDLLAELKKSPKFVNVNKDQLIINKPALMPRLVKSSRVETITDHEKVDIESNVSVSLQTDKDTPIVEQVKIEDINTSIPEPIETEIYVQQMTSPILDNLIEQPMMECIDERVYEITGFEVVGDFIPINNMTECVDKSVHEITNGEVITDAINNVKEEKNISITIIDCNMSGVPKFVPDRSKSIPIINYDSLPTINYDSEPISVGKPNDLSCMNLEEIRIDKFEQ